MMNKLITIVTSDAAEEHGLGRSSRDAAGPALPRSEIPAGRAGLACAMDGLLRFGGGGRVGPSG